MSVISDHAETDAMLIRTYSAIGRLLMIGPLTFALVFRCTTYRDTPS